MLHLVFTFTVAVTMSKPLCSRLSLLGKYTFFALTVSNKSLIRTKYLSVRTVTLFIIPRFTLENDPCSV